MISEDLYRGWIYPLIGRVDPERAHRLALRTLRATGRIPGGLRLLERQTAPPRDARLVVDCLGLRFANPLGVAAGLDKDADAVEPLFRLGFGAVEVGTVTPEPQPGNPPPRLWRFPGDRALINALGFPSQGAATVRARLVGRRFSGVLGINLGKNRATSAEEAAEDYVAVLDVLWDVAAYFTVNVSSPNTPGLRDLQARDALTGLLMRVGEANRRAARLHRGLPRPVLVKIAPDLDDHELEDVLAGALDGGADGIIVANTTTSREGLRRAAPNLPGGMSGRPLRDRATRLVREVRRRAGSDLPIIGVGGIATAADVVERMRAGADLVQLYTGFIYGGPGLPAEILRDLRRYVECEGLRSITEIVGVDCSRPD